MAAVRGLHWFLSSSSLRCAVADEYWKPFRFPVGTVGGSGGDGFSSVVLQWRVLVGQWWLRWASSEVVGGGYGFLLRWLLGFLHRLKCFIGCALLARPLDAVILGCNDVSGFPHLG